MTARENVKEEKRNNATELVFIIDRSGSMSGLESDTLGGFNSMIARQKDSEGECLVTTVLFNSSTERIHDRVSVTEISPMTSADYVPGGCTALIDAIGETADHIADVHRYIRPDDVPAKTLFVITTDGLENASHKYTADKVRKMIEDRKKKDGWEFLFIGANIDSVQTAGRIGIAAECAVDYRADRKGTGVLYEALADTVCEMRSTGKVSKNWKRKIEKDAKSR